MSNEVRLGAHLIQWAIYCCFWSGFHTSWAWNKDVVLLPLYCTVQWSTQKHTRDSVARHVNQLTWLGLWKFATWRFVCRGFAVVLLTGLLLSVVESCQEKRRESLTWERYKEGYHWQESSNVPTASSAGPRSWSRSLSADSSTAFSPLLMLERIFLLHSSLPEGNLLTTDHSRDSW